MFFKLVANQITVEWSDHKGEINVSGHCFFAYHEGVILLFRGECGLAKRGWLGVETLNYTDKMQVSLKKADDCLTFLVS